MRSISLYGLSDVILTFDEGTTSTGGGAKSSRPEVARAKGEATGGQ